MNKLEIALKESIKLQSHYASLLNQYDGGERMVFNSPEEWIERLEKTGVILPNKPVEPTKESAVACSVCGVVHPGVRCPKIWG